MKNFLKRISSRKFLVVVLIPTSVVVNWYFEMNMSAEEIIGIVAAVLGYLGVEGYADIISRQKAIDATEQMQDLIELVMDSNTEVVDAVPEVTEGKLLE